VRRGIAALKICATLAYAKAAPQSDVDLLQQVATEIRVGFANARQAFERGPKRLSERLPRFLVESVLLRSWYHRYGLICAHIQVVTGMRTFLHLFCGGSNDTHRTSCAEFGELWRVLGDSCRMKSPSNTAGADDTL
jgi:hypothetical protein